MPSAIRCVDIGRLCRPATEAVRRRERRHALVWPVIEGKTTGLTASVSVWGGDDHKVTWNDTINGLEGAAALYNDSSTALDEINQGDPDAVDKTLYTIANGSGKQRANGTGHARAVERWRTFLVSTGEKTMETHLLDMR